MSTETKGKFAPCASNSSNTAESNFHSNSLTESLPYYETRDPSLTPPMSSLKFPPSNDMKEQMLLLPRKIYLATRFSPTGANLHLQNPYNRSPD